MPALKDRPGKRGDELIMDWKYADATWFDLMRVHRISSLSRFVSLRRQARGRPSSMSGSLFLRAVVMLGALLAGAMPAQVRAQAPGVPASFDCAKAERVVERFICMHAVLRWQDLALSRSYAAAKARVTGAARDGLVATQRDWLRERDRRCIADRSFKELAVPSALRTQAYDCLDIVYLDRRNTLQDRAAEPLAPRDAAEIDLRPIAVQRPDAVVGAELRVAGIKASSDNAMLAILLPSQEIDLPDQVWLYRIADRKLVAATPGPDPARPHPDGSPASIEALAWQGGTLYARVATWARDAGEKGGARVVYAATAAGSKRLDVVPNAIAALLDGADPRSIAEQDEVPESEGAIPESIQGNRHFLAWVRDLGHGTLELGMRERARGSPARLVAWGSWSLWPYLFDADRSQLVYAADTGIVLFDMKTGSERRIAGTSRGDLPRALSPDHRLFVWSTRNRCGDEFLTEPDESEPERFCLAHLPGAGGKR